MVDESILETIYYIEVVRLCGVLTQGRDVVKTFYPLLAHETILTIIMGVHTWRNFKRGIGGPSLPLLTVLYRDGALFYLIVLGLRIWIIYTVRISSASYLVTDTFKAPDYAVDTIIPKYCVCPLSLPTRTSLMNMLM